MQPGQGNTIYGVCDVKFELNMSINFLFLDNIQTTRLKEKKKKRKKTKKKKKHVIIPNRSKENTKFVGTNNSLLN